MGFDVRAIGDAVLAEVCLKPCNVPLQAIKINDGYRSVKIVNAHRRCLSCGKVSDTIVSDRCAGDAGRL
jgi:hypothetical protein